MREMILRHMKGQGMIEYGILLLVAVAALMAMTTYLMRASNARIRHSIDEINYYREE